MYTFTHLTEDVLSTSTPKDKILTLFREEVADWKFTIEHDMSEKPWGAGYRFSEKDLPDFLHKFFPERDIKTDPQFPLSPKILIIAPEAMLSWQRHERRAEIWKVVGGKVGTIVSDTEEQPPVQEHSPYDVIEVDCGQCHRIVGLDQWGIIAEIWKHTDSSNPSNEEDNERLEDQYGREGTTTV